MCLTMLNSSLATKLLPSTLTLHTMGTNFCLSACVTPVSSKGSRKESRPEAVLVDSDALAMAVHILLYHGLPKLPSQPVQLASQQVSIEVMSFLDNSLVIRPKRVCRQGLCS